MFSLFKTTVFAAVVVVSFSGISGQVNHTSAYVQGEQCASELVDMFLEKLKNNGTQAGEARDFMKTYDSKFHETHERRDFYNGITAGLEKIDIKKVVTEHQLNQDQHAGLLAGIYVLIVGFPFAAENPQGAKPSAVQAQAFMTAMFKAMLQAYEEVYEENSDKYRELESGLKMVGASIAGAAESATRK